MSIEIPSINLMRFEAQWTPELAPFNFEEFTFFKKTAVIAKEFFLLIPKWLLGDFLKKNVVPSTCYSLQTIQEKETAFNQIWSENRFNFLYRAHRFEVKTPDGALIHGIFYQNKEHVGQDIPTIINFHGNASTSFDGNELLRDAQMCSTPFNLIDFDYRGTVKSTGESTSEGFIIDGASIYQFVKQRLNISEQNIVFYGFSLGGGVSSEVKALIAPHSGGKIILDRTFSSLYNAVQTILCTYFHCPYSLGVLIAYFVYMLGWDFDTHRAFSQITDLKLVFNHAEDEIIPRQAALAYQLACQEGIIQLSRSSSYPFVHAAPHDMLFNDEGMPISHRIFSFIAAGQA